MVRYVFEPIPKIIVLNLGRQSIKESSVETFDCTARLYEPKLSRGPKVGRSVITQNRSNCSQHSFKAEWYAH